MSDKLRQDVMREADRLTRNVNQLTQDRERLTSQYRDDKLPRVVGEPGSWTCPNCGQDSSAPANWLDADRLHRCKSCRSFYVVGTRVGERREIERRKKSTPGRRE